MILMTQATGQPDPPSFPLSVHLQPCPTSLGRPSQTSHFGQHSLSSMHAPTCQCTTHTMHAPKCVVQPMAKLVATALMLDIDTRRKAPIWAVRQQRCACHTLPGLSFIVESHAVKEQLPLNMHTGWHTGWACRCASFMRPQISAQRADEISHLAAACGRRGQSRPGPTLQSLHLCTGPCKKTHNSC
jgi:hypothetical protein